MGREQLGSQEPRVCGVRQQAALCPMCGGAALTPQRGAWRCTRCGFSLCVGCEPEMLPGQHQELASDAA